MGCSEKKDNHMQQETKVIQSNTSVTDYGLVSLTNTFMTVIQKLTESD